MLVSAAASILVRRAAKDIAFHSAASCVWVHRQPGLRGSRASQRAICVSRPVATAVAELAPAAAYIHLPFCRQRCHYCAFPVIVPSATRSVAAAADDEERYIKLLLAEIAAAGRMTVAHVPLTSVYFGGGTPSLTSSRGLARILNALDKSFGIAVGCEITCEMDPATFDLTKAASFKAIGVNRASVGAQSFDEDLLRICGRGHSVSDIYDALSFLRRAGIENISLDLISGLPGQTMNMWHHALDEVLRLGPAHVSAYDLTIEANTKFGKLYKEGLAPLPPETDSADMLNATSERLRGAGYVHYEVSNYALEQEFRSRHNLAYWKSKLFYAFGLGSTSLTRLPSGNLVRFARPKGMSTYTKYCHDLEALFEEEAEDERITSAMYLGCKPCSPEEVLEDALINGLRLLEDGVDLIQFEQRFGPSIVQDLVSGFRQAGFGDLGLAELVCANDLPIRLRLTESGALLENTIVSSLLLSSVWKHRSGKPDLRSATNAESLPVLDDR
jgi:putative oxygen-independent coproporphyrinogen III oxidase